MCVVLLLFVYTFPVTSNEILWNVFSGFHYVVSRCIFLQSYNVVCFVFFSFVLYNANDNISWIGIAVIAHSVYFA